MYRLYPEMWARYRVDGGSMVLEPRGLGCWQVMTANADSSKQEVRQLKPRIFNRQALARAPKSNPASVAANRQANPYDPVDATFTVANFLAQNGAFKSKKWSYSGSPPQQCTTEVSDGPIWYPPQLDFGYGAGARVGYNARLDIPRSIALLAAKYRSNQGRYKPRRDPDKNRSPVPKKDIVKILTAVWAAFGARGQELRNNVSANYAQIGLESGGRPYILQGFIGDVNDNNPAGGLMQFIPSTFEHWKVDGFDDRFNPLDNILAAVNAQVNGPYPILDGSSGWSPPFSKNPYARGGRSRLVGESETSGQQIARKPYRGRAQVDPISQALRQQRPGAPSSDCYIAVVNNWYKMIVANPPLGALIVGPLRERIVKIAQAELQKKVAESGGDNVPRYQSSGKIADYNISAAWCQTFASWIYYQAGIKQITKAGGMTQSGGLTMPASVAAMTSYAQSGAGGFKYKTDNPQPGDMAMYGGGHVEIVEKVLAGRVLSTIGGNTSNAVTRVTAPGGITHFVAPPSKAGPSTYNLQDSEPQAAKRLQQIIDKLQVRAGVVDTRGRQSVSAGELISAPAGETIDLLVLKAATERVERNELRFMLLTPGPLSRQGVLADLQPRAQQLLAQAMRPAPGAALRSGQQYGATIWPAGVANQFAIRLARDKKLTSELKILASAERPWRYQILSVSGGQDYQRRWLFRALFFNKQQARTIVIASDDYRQGQKAIQRLARWR
jgi:hypothetical protein